jgi:hypothetical protein
MNFGILDLAGIGAVALLAAAVVLLPMVLTELAPAVRLAGKGL